MTIYNEIIKNCNNLCFDVGANIGNRTQMFLELGFKRVVAIEPQQDCLEILKNRFINDNRVTIISDALSDSNGISKIFISNANTISSMSEEFISETQKERFKSYNWNSSYEVKTSTLHDIMCTHGIPDFCKIDVEGYELNVITGLVYPIKYISLEYTPELHNKSMMCIDKLNSIGDYLYNFSVGETLEYSLDTWVDKNYISEWLIKNIHNKKDQHGLLFGDIYAKLIINK